jgi:hypothetical protein
MAKPQHGQERKSRPVRWLHGEIKTPPFTEEARREAGFLLRQLQDGEPVKYPQAEPLPTVGRRCGEVIVRCKKRLKDYDDARTAQAKKQEKNDER